MTSGADDHHIGMSVPWVSRRYEQSQLNEEVHLGKFAVIHNVQLYATKVYSRVGSCGRS